MRLKTGANSRFGEQHPRRAEFFALPIARQHRGNRGCRYLSTHKRQLFLRFVAATNYIDPAKPAVELFVRTSRIIERFSIA
jgi:hypothetical protein